MLLSAAELAGGLAWQPLLGALATRIACLLQACKHCMPEFAAVYLPVLAMPQGIHDTAWQARPAVLATKIALLDASGQSAQAAATLSSALDHWRAGGCALWI